MISKILCALWLSAAIAFAGATLTQSTTSAVFEPLTEGYYYQVTAGGTWDGATISVEIYNHLLGNYVPASSPLLTSASNTKRLIATGQKMRVTVNSSTSNTSLAVEYLKIPPGVNSTPLSVAEMNSIESSLSKADTAASRTFYPETYGAVGDGTTNDDAAVQAAIDAAKVAGGTVFLSKLYGLSAGVTVDKGWIRIEGFSGGGYYEDGNPRSGFKCLGTTTVAITVQSGVIGKTNRGLAFRDFSIVGADNFSGVTTCGIDFKYRSGGYGIPSDCAIVDRVNFQFLNNALRSETDDSLTVTNCRICNNWRGVYLKNSINAAVSGNIIYDNGQYGIHINGASYGCVITGNTIGRDATSIYAEYHHSLVITGNCFTNDDSTPGTHTNAILIYYGDVQGATSITGNVFRAINASGSSMRYTEAIVNIRGSANVAVTGNSFDLRNNTIPAVWARASSAVIVGSNVFSANTAVPITIADDTNANIMISNNLHVGKINLPAAYKMGWGASYGIPERANEAACATALASSTTTNASTTIAVSSTSGLYAGMAISGTGIAADTCIATVTSGTGITMTKPATATGTVTLTFTLQSGTFYKTSTGELRIKL